MSSQILLPNPGPPTYKASTQPLNNPSLFAYFKIELFFILSSLYIVDISPWWAVWLTVCIWSGIDVMNEDLKSGKDSLQFNIQWDFLNISFGHQFISPFSWSFSCHSASHSFNDELFPLILPLIVPKTILSSSLHSFSFFPSHLPSVFLWHGSFFLLNKLCFPEEWLRNQSFSVQISTPPEGHPNSSS